MPSLYYMSVPFVKNDVLCALEAGIDGLIVPDEAMECAKHFARVPVLGTSKLRVVHLGCKADEEAYCTASANVAAEEHCVLASGWEVIPIENLLARGAVVWAEAENAAAARLATGILERGVHGIILLPQALGEISQIVQECKLAQAPVPLTAAKITSIEPIGLGHRVCVDSISAMQKGQGLLVGNSSAFTFLVHAETEHNAYVASRPFRVNAGGLHCYVRLPHDKTCYLEELAAGHPLALVRSDGTGYASAVGRVKIEQRPMLLISAKAGNAEGSIVLQNAETICLTAPNGEPVSVVALHVGDEILCALDTAGRHFGMRIEETIQEK